MRTLVALAMLVAACDPPIAIENARDAGLPRADPAPPPEPVERPVPRASPATALPAGLASVEPDSCGRCHRAELRDWRRSGHARAFTEPLFQHEWAPRRAAWCSSCHAPATAVLARDHPGFGAAAARGVDCAACHVRDGAVIAAEVSGRAPHASRAVPALATPEACARCHEFRGERSASLMVQATLTEHSESTAGARGVPCQRCHMPERGTHRFPGARDASMRRRALAIRAEAVRDGDDVRLTMRLRVDRAGHAVPTGDLARVLEIRAHLVGDPGSSRSVELGREIVARDGELVELEDTRVPPQGVREVVLVLTGRGRSVAWRVDLWTLPFELADLEHFEERELRHPVASGRVGVR